MSSSPVITIYRGFIGSNAFIWSPYVTKLEARLRFSAVSYKTAVGSPRSGPKGKIPYVELSSPNSSAPEVLADSTLITNTLIERGTLPDLHARLSKVERAHDLALRALLEEKLSPYHTWERWTQNYYTMRDHVLWSLPWPIRIVVGSIIYRSQVSTLQGQGTGRFTAEEIGHFRREIWSSFADLLLESKSKSQSQSQSQSAEPQQPFWVLGGPSPTEVDTTLFGFVVSTLICTAGPASQADLKSFPVLVEYAHRIQQRYFPDYEALPA